LNLVGSGEMRAISPHPTLSAALFIRLGAAECQR